MVQVGHNDVEIPRADIAPTWRPYGAGRITISYNLPVFPKGPSGTIPGVYRLRFDDQYVYIGKAKNLCARFGFYRTPSDGTEQEHVIRYILVNAGGATVEVLTGNELNDGRGRDLREREEIKAAKREKVLLLNKGGLGYLHYLRFRVKYYDDMLVKARADLSLASSIPCVSAES